MNRDQITHSSVFSVFIASDSGFCAERERERERRKRKII